jgi:hypothetical protein
MQHPTHPVSARYSLPERCETARNLACVHQTDPLSVLDASPPSGEPGWSSEGTGRGGRNGQRGVFGNGVTYAARGPCGAQLLALAHQRSTLDAFPAVHFEHVDAPFVTLSSLEFSIAVCKGAEAWPVLLTLLYHTSRCPQLQMRWAGCAPSYTCTYGTLCAARNGTTAWAWR